MIPTYVCSHLAQTLLSLAIAQFGKSVDSKHAVTIGNLLGK